MVARMARQRQAASVGLVLGAGGVLGAAWMTGALTAVQVRVPFPVSEAGLIVGISAGSVMAAALDCSAVAPWPVAWPGSPGLILRALRSPRSVHPWAVAAACLPSGRAEHRMLRALSPVRWRAIPS
jgi:NTE family protein